MILHFRYGMDSIWWVKSLWRVMYLKRNLLRKWQVVLEKYNYRWSEDDWKKGVRKTFHVSLTTTPNPSGKGVAVFIWVLNLGYTTTFSPRVWASFTLVWALFSCAWTSCTPFPLSGLLFRMCAGSQLGPRLLTVLPNFYFFTKVMSEANSKG